MRKNLILGLAIIILIVTPCVYASAAQTSGNSGSATSTTLDMVPFTLTSAKDNGLVYTDSIKNIAGEDTLIYEKGEYQYYYPSDTESLYMVVMNNSGFTRLEEAYLKNSTPISSKDANAILHNVISRFFPEMDQGHITISETIDTGSFLGYFEYIIEETFDCARINMAAVTLAYNGEITSITGTHNDSQQFAEYTINQNSAKHAVYLYLIKHKEEIETCFTFTKEQEVTEYTGEHDQLPNYELYIEDEESMIEANAIRVKRHGLLVWAVEFDVKTSWGLYDNILNTHMIVYVDSNTGTVCGLETTDSILELDTEIQADNLTYSGR